MLDTAQHMVKLMVFFEFELHLFLIYIFHSIFASGSIFHSQSQFLRHVISLQHVI